MKTAAQAALDYLFDNYNVQETAVQNAFKAGIEFAQQWISTEDELPKDDVCFPFTKYLVMIDIYAENYHSHTVTVATFNQGKWNTDRVDSDIQDVVVTHWRQITIE